MKKFIKKFVTSAISAIVCVSLVITSGCKKDEPINPGNNANNGGKAEPTENYLVKNGVSEYRIVLPAKVDDTLTFAANEIQTFLYEATGATLDIGQDTKDTKYEKVISLGKTGLINESRTIIPSTLGNSGFILKSYENSYILGGNTSDACLYAAYEFMKYEIGLEVYATDEIYVNKSSDVMAYDFDVTYNPSFDQIRAASYYEINNDTILAQRLKLKQYAGSHWVDIGGHNSFNIVSPSMYQNAHPDWFNGTVTQLCYSNEEMKATFIDNLMDFIAKSPSAKYAILSLQDNADFCNCEKCAASRRKYGTDSATYILFLNDVAKEANRRLNGEREITFYMLAYLALLEAPAHQSAETDEWEVNSPDIITDEHVGVLYAPMHSDFRYSFGDAENNSETKGILDAWAKVTSNLGVYSYGHYVNDMFIPFNSYNVMKDNMLYLQSMGAKFYYTQGFQVSNIGSFTNLNTYLNAKLLWDLSLNPDDVITDFCNHYYGAAGKYFKEYFDLYRSQMTMLQTFGKVNGSIYAKMSAENWPKYFVDSLKEKIDLCYEAIQNEPEELRTKYFNRIKKEELSVIYMYLELNNKYFTNSEMDKMINEFEKYTAEFNITNYGEVNCVISELIQSWKNRLS